MTYQAVISLLIFLTLSTASSGAESPKSPLCFGGVQKLGETSKRENESTVLQRQIEFAKRTQADYEQRLHLIESQAKTALGEPRPPLETFQSEDEVQGAYGEFAPMVVTDWNGYERATKTYFDRVRPGLGVEVLRLEELIKQNYVEFQSYSRKLESF